MSRISPITPFVSSFRALLLLAMLCLTAQASGPRFVSGTSSFWSSGVAMPFFTNTPLYYTDPSNLSPTVTHAQADAMVAAAASVWNVPQASLVLAQGGQLAEHVSSANTYFDGTQFVFPADVEAANYLQIPIAVIYDTDGSITDLLLGSGASQPLSCRQNAVTESVDAFGSDMKIDHALLIVNGRCVSDTATRTQELAQMQYQLERAFGRILGLAWSQLNDNVFTGSPAPTAFQMSYWPVMHPIDVLCGSYSYQCMRNPFTLRTDDIASLAYLYPNSVNTVVPGKIWTQNDAFMLMGNVSFPSGQQAEMVNITVQRWLASMNKWEQAPIVSTVSGPLFQQNSGNPVSGPEPATLNAGSPGPSNEGSFFLPMVPTGNSFTNIFIQTEPINPLYWGEYAVSASQRPVITLPGTAPTAYGWTLATTQFLFIQNFTLSMPTACSPTYTGTEASPVAPDPSGWWSDQLCSPGGSGGASSWFTTTIRANRTWTIEATAQDINGNATIQGLQPVLGAWAASDPTGSLPTIAAAPNALNAITFGMTQMYGPALSADTPLRFTIADQYGLGRPDFHYHARLLYADSVSPTTIPLTGASITITGTGFQNGNTVSINGVPATVTQWSPTQITAIAPDANTVGAGTDPVDVQVTDPITNASTDIAAALTYANIAPIRAVTIPTTPVMYAATGAGTWNLTALATENGIPAAATDVQWSSSSPSLTLSQAQSTTNAAGSTTTTVATAGLPIGANTITACAWSSVCATWTLTGVDPALWAIAVQSNGSQTLTSGQTPANIVLQVSDGSGHPLQGALVHLHQTDYAWEGDCTSARCPAAPVLATSQTSAISDANGLVAVTPLITAGQPQTIAIAATAGLNGLATTVLTLHP
jgi:hypothetical protein